MAKSKKKVSIQARRRLFFSRPICFFLVIFVAIALVYNVVEIYKLTNEKKKKEEEYVKLQEESEYLKNEIIKLNNPEYLANFAREHYSYSKDGELIIQIEEPEEALEEVVETDVDVKDYNIVLYIVIGSLIALVVVIGCKKKYSDN